MRFAITKISILLILLTLSQINGNAKIKMLHRENDTVNIDSTNVNIKYIQRLERYERAWINLIPSYAKIQYAGNMGMFSFGTGWCYGKNDQWETDALFGFIPKYDSKTTKVTFTLKENFTPWKVECNKHFYFEPLSCGIYLNSILNDEFWVKAPDKYPKGYYWFATKIRINVFVGERLTFKIPTKHRFFAKTLTVFYEISSSDFAVMSAIGNAYLKPSDYLTLSFGVKFNWL